MSRRRDHHPRDNTHLTKTKTAHVIDLFFSQAWQEWLPSCTCGWTGSFCTARESAKRLAAKHLGETAKKEQT